MNRPCRAVTLSLALFSTVAIAQSEAPRSSAMLSEVEGSVLVNQGEQFVGAEDGVSLVSGDRVMAMEGASALLRYEDGCDVRIEPATVVTLSEGSPCAGWLLAVESVAPGGGAVGATTAAAGSGISPWVYVPAAAVALYAINEEFFDDPSSP